MPSKNRRSRGSKTRKNGGDPGDRMVIASHHQSGRAFVDSATGDLVLKPPIMRLNLRIPRNYLNLPVWLQSQVTEDLSTSASVTTSIAQTFSLSDTNIASAVANLFDQFSIYCVNVTLCLKDTNAGQIPRVTTAIDFDGQSFLSPPTSAATINQYSTSLTSLLNDGQSHERFIKPCCASSLFQSSSSTFAAYATERLWVDSANPSTVFYGLLGVVEQASNAPIVSRVTTYIVVCRNNN